MPNIPIPAGPGDCTWALAVDPTPESFPEILSGNIVDAFGPKVNKTAALLEVLCRYGIGGYAVLEGLEIDDDGLDLTIAVGLAAIDSVIPVRTELNYTVPASEATVNIFLKQDGTLAHSLTSAPPAGKVLYIGQVTTNVSGVTAMTTHGVVYSKGGCLWRTMSAIPSDSPPAGARLFTQVGADVYLWDGSDHRLISLTP